MALVDLDLDVKPYLEIAPTNTTSDDALSLFMEAATTFFESYTGRMLEEQDLTHQFHGNGEHKLQLREFPVSQVTFAAIDPAWQFATPLDVSGLLIDNELYLYRQTVWPQGVKNIQIGYTAGYPADDVPIDLKQACLLMVEFLYHGRSDHRLGVTNRNKIGETLTFQDTVPKVILDMLAPYVRKVAVAELVRRAGG